MDNQKYNEKLLGMLTMWISTQDKSSEIYDFIRGDMDEKEYQMFDAEDHQFLLNWLKEEYDTDESSEKWYQKGKAEYEEYKCTTEERKKLWSKIGRNSKIERLKSGLTLEQLAEKTWYHVDDIAYLERGGEYDKRMVLSLNNAITAHMSQAEFIENISVQESTILH